VATEVLDYEQNQTVYSPICSSIYEDAPLNYLIDYAFADSSFLTDRVCQNPRVRRSGQQDLLLSVRHHVCNTAYNSRIIHLENAKLPAVGPRLLNLSTRSLVQSGDDVLITVLSSAELIPRQ